MSILGQKGLLQHAQKNNEEKSKTMLNNVAMCYHLIAYMGMIHS